MVMCKKLAITGFMISGIFFFTIVTAQLKPAEADSFLHFIQANKNKAAVFISNNDTIIAALNENKLMPLASTVKLMVAVEFAKQAGKNIIDPEALVALSELDKYYLPNTDGGAHTDWLTQEQKNNNIKNDSISLLNVARGMMRFSSNANAEYLMDLLGFDNVKNNIQLFGLKQHTVIFPMVASLLMYQNPRKLPETKVLKAIGKLPEEAYCKYIFMLHNQLKYSSRLKASFQLQAFSQSMQQMWSNRLPSATAKEYVQLVKILNDRKFLDDATYAILAEIVEYPMEDARFQKIFKHYGVKGGSTQFVLTHTLYFTTKQNSKMELAIFFNDLTMAEKKQLENWLDPFEAQVIFDKAFRRQLLF